MTDIFDTKIICKHCGVEMQQDIIERSGMELRAVICPKCNDKIIHPADLNSLHQFNTLKGKTFNVKLRMVGNSHAISIPKEIIEFMEDQERVAQTHMRDMVRLCFEDFHKLSVMFGDNNGEEE